MGSGVAALEMWRRECESDFETVFALKMISARKKNHVRVRRSNGTSSCLASALESANRSWWAKKASGDCSYFLAVIPVCMYVQQGLCSEENIGRAPRYALLLRDLLAIRKPVVDERRCSYEPHVSTRVLVHG